MCKLNKCKNLGSIPLDSHQTGSEPSIFRLVISEYSKQIIWSSGFLFIWPSVRFRYNVPVFINCVIFCISIFLWWASIYMLSLMIHPERWYLLLLFHSDNQFALLHLCNQMSDKDKGLLGQIHYIYKWLEYLWDVQIVSDCLFEYTSNSPMLGIVGLFFVL